MIDNTEEHFYTRMHAAQLELFKLARYMRAHSGLMWHHAVPIGYSTRALGHPTIVSTKRKTI